MTGDELRRLRGRVNRLEQPDLRERLAYAWQEVEHLRARLVERRGFDPGDTDLCQADPVVEDSPVLVGINSVSIQGRIALVLVGARLCGV